MATRSRRFEKRTSASGVPRVGHSVSGSASAFFFKSCVPRFTDSSSAAPLSLSPRQGKVPSCISASAYNKLHRSSLGPCSMPACALTDAYVVDPRNATRSSAASPSSRSRADASLASLVSNFFARPRSMSRSSRVPDPAPDPRGATVMLLGFTSRCTYPRAWMARSVSRTRTPIQAMVLLLCRRSATRVCRMSARFSPPSCITMNGCWFLCEP